MPENEPQIPSPVDTWREYITQSERQWNGFFRDVFSTDAFSGSMNAWVEASLTIQRMMADQLERLYTTFNIPTHQDLVSLGERMKGIEDQLARLELKSAAGSGARSAAPSTRRKPKRTKQPASANGARKT